MRVDDIKSQSERIIAELGGGVCDWLPVLERSGGRPSAEVADRALVLLAMLQIYFGAPTNAIADWIGNNRLHHAMSRSDRALLSKPREQLSEAEKTGIYWHLEALWALVWAGSLIDRLPIETPVGSNLASLVPNIRVGEDAAQFQRRFKLRPFDEIYAMLDLYYRAHWYAREGNLRGYSTAPFNLDIIMERRQALEWACDAELQDWDEAPTST